MMRVDWGPESRPAVAIGLVGRHLRVEVASMLCDVLKSQGHRTSILSDGDPSAWDHDILLLPGRATQFVRFAAMMQECPGPRPLTVVWQNEPLPPPLADDRADELGRHVARPKWEHLFGRWARQLDRMAPPAGELARLLRRPAAARWNRHFSGLFKPGWPIDPQDLCLCMQQAQWILHNARGDRAWVDLLVCSKPSGARYLASHGVPAHFVPLGYHTLWGRDLGLVRDIDVLFLGAVRASGRRKAVTGTLRALRRLGYRTAAIERGYHLEERVRLLNRARIVLNLVKYPWEYPGMRLLMSTSCGAMVVSNEAQSTEPYRAGRDFVTTTVDGAVEVIRGHLDDEPARQAFVHRAQEHMTREMTMGHSVTAILNLCRQAARGSEPARLPVRELVA